MFNIKEIIDNIIIKRGLNITDNEFKLRGYIYFGNKIINYRDKDLPYLIIKDDFKGNITKIINNLETFTIVINIAIDYIIAKRVLYNIDILDDMIKIDKEIRDKKINKILE